MSFVPLQLTAPQAECAEISLFGPGIGECIVIHYGDGRWFIIDSCLNPGVEKRPVALDYLEAIGIDVTTQVTHILLTHFHSDHISGAYQLFEICKSAELHISSALLSDQAYKLISLFKQAKFGGINQEFNELTAIYDSIRESKYSRKILQVQAHHTFIDDRSTQPARMSRIVALSPSPAASIQSKTRLVAMTPVGGSYRLKGVLPESENLNAVAIHFQFGKFSALLGADLEESEDINTGWSAILDSKIMDKLGLPQSKVYKVAHHGSVTAHHDEIWNTLLEKLPISITTPFTRSHLPTQADVNRINPLSSMFVVTRDPTNMKPPKREPSADRLIKNGTKSRYAVNDKMGHIQIRATADGAITVALTDNCKVHKKAMKK